MPLTIPKYQQLNLIGDIFEPKYSENVVYIAKYKIDRSKLDIHLRFSNVSPTSDYYGDWFIPLKEAKKCRRAFNNNGLECVAIPFDKFQRFERAAQDVRDYL